MTVNEPIYRRNFFFFLIDAILFTVALGVMGMNTVIPDFVRRLTDSEILIGLSGSLFTICYSLPQLFIARYIVRQSRKKWWFVGPNIPVRSVILLFAGVLFLLGGERPQLILIAFFVCYGLAAIGDGLVGVPWADLSATCLDGRWRARMFGWTTAISGLIMLLVTPLIGRVLGDGRLAFPNNYAVLFAIAGGLFVLSIIPGLFFHELPSRQETVAELPPLREFLGSLGNVLRQDRSFRAFLLTSVFTGLLMMAAPFYIGFATEDLGLSSDVAVPILIAMQTIGSVLGALAYTWIGVKHNVQYIRAALVVLALLPITALVASLLGPWVLYLGFLISGIASGSILFSAYLNWVVSYAPEEVRPVYVGLYNTTNAVVWLVTPIVGGAIVQRFGFPPVFVVSFVMALVSLYIATQHLEVASTMSE